MCQNSVFSHKNTPQANAHPLEPPVCPKPIIDSRPAAVSPLSYVAPNPHFKQTVISPRINVSVACQEIQSRSSTGETNKRPLPPARIRSNTDQQLNHITSVTPQPAPNSSSSAMPSATTKPTIHNLLISRSLVNNSTIAEPTAINSESTFNSAELSRRDPLRDDISSVSGNISNHSHLSKSRSPLLQKLNPINNGSLIKIDGDIQTKQSPSKSKKTIFFNDYKKQLDNGRGPLPDVPHVMSSKSSQVSNCVLDSVTKNYSDSSGQRYTTSSDITDYLPMEFVLNGILYRRTALCQPTKAPSYPRRPSYVRLASENKRKFPFIQLEVHYDGILCFNECWLVKLIYNFIVNRTIY